MDQVPDGIAVVVESGSSAPAEPPATAVIGRAVARRPTLVVVAVPPTATTILQPIRLRLLKNEQTNVNKALVRADTVTCNTHKWRGSARTCPRWFYPDTDFMSKRRCWLVSLYVAVPRAERLAGRGMVPAQGGHGVASVSAVTGHGQLVLTRLVSDEERRVLG